MTHSMIECSYLCDIGDENDAAVSVGKSDWTRVDSMTDEEITAAALSDPDAQPRRRRRPHRPAN
jgi:hypothetical protein